MTQPSASELLRALDEAITDLTPFKGASQLVCELSLKESSAGVVNLRNALPALVEVVEAAEALVVQGGGLEIESKEYLIEPALARLREALGG